ncbi:hypothetical protein BJY00DRAFT_294603 [Aspergillus carlsbadensis]|nr:hypothetical protein BJY00DRAFT_294603 [Aspergillus carlsbadensis]
MEEPPSMDHSLSTLSTFALNASMALYSIAGRYEFRPKAARELLADTQDLIEALSSLSQIISALAEVDLAALKLPLLQCGIACSNFEREIKKCLPYPGNKGAEHRGWARLEYIGGDINHFKELLSGYKSTFQATLADANLCRQSSFTVESLEAHKDQLEIAKTDLELHLDSADRTLGLILDTDTSGLHHHREQRRAMEKCLQICIQLSDRVSVHEAKQKEDDCQDLPSLPNKNRNENISIISNYSTGDAVLFMVSTDGTVLHGSNRALGWRARHLGGHVDNPTARQISRDFTSINAQSLGNNVSHTKRDVSSTAGNGNLNQPISDFDMRTRLYLPDQPYQSSNFSDEIEFKKDI